MPNSGRQVVTGVVVNRKVSRGRREIEPLRNEILELSDAADIPESQRNSLRGKVSYVRTLCPAQGAVLESLLDRVLGEKV